MVNQGKDLREVYQSLVAISIQGDVSHARTGANYIAYIDGKPFGKGSTIEECVGSVPSTIRAQSTLVISQNYRPDDRCHKNTNYSSRKFTWDDILKE